MDIYQALSSDRSKAGKDRLVAYIDKDPQRFSDLFDIFMNGEVKIRERAAWVLSYCAGKTPELIDERLPVLVQYLDKPDTPDAIKRNSLRILQNMAIPKPLEGSLMDICFRLLEDKNQPVAVRVFSMQVLANLAGIYPEIKNELKDLISHELPFAKPAFVSRGKKIIKVLDKH